MKKNILSFILTMFSITVFAQDKNSDAYNAGYMFGKGIGLLLLSGLVVWGIWKVAKKKKQ